MKRTQKQNWGSLAIVLVFLFIGAIFAGGFFKTFTQNSGLLIPKSQLKVIFTNIGGLKVGAPVLLAGWDIGEVVDIEFYDDWEEPALLVTINIKDDVMTRIKKDSKVSIQNQSLLGEKYVDISFGSKNAAPVNPEEIIVGKDPVLMSDLLEDYEELSPEIKKMVKRIGGIAEGLGEIMDTIGQVINMLKNLEQ